MDSAWNFDFRVLIFGVFVTMDLSVEKVFFVLFWHFVFVVENAWKNCFRIVFRRAKFSRFCHAFFMVFVNVVVYGMCQCIFSWYLSMYLSFQFPFFFHDRFVPKMEADT